MAEPEQILMQCSGCGAEAVVYADDWEAQRTFRASHLPAPCSLGSGGKPYWTP